MRKSLWMKCFVVGIILSFVGVSVIPSITGNIGEKSEVRYNPDLPLVIDSELIYSTFLGGTANDIVYYGVAVDANGYIYIAGCTTSYDFPTTPGAYDTTHNGSADVFVTKLSPAGDTLVYSTFLGGNSDETEWGYIAVDANGCAYVTGGTISSDFPTTPGAYDTTYNGEWDVFVTKLSPAGDTLVYSTFLGGSASDESGGITVDSQGNALITGLTFSSDFPTTPGSYDTTYNFNGDVFITKLSSAGDTLVYSTLLGGIHQDVGYCIVEDANGYATITGDTSSIDFPTTPGSYDTTYNGDSDVFVTTLSPSGDTLTYSTFLGGTDHDMSYCIVEDAHGYLFITGRTESSDFPTTPGAYDTTYNGIWDVFVTKLSPSRDILVYSTFIGGGNHEEGLGISVDTQGYGYITGWTDSSDFPTTPDAYDTTYNGGYDVFMTKLSPSGNTVAYSTFLGGTNNDMGYNIAVDGADYVYLTGSTWSNNFPTTSGPYDTTHNGLDDVFVVKFPYDVNYPPTMPDPSLGPTQGEINVNYTFCINVSDPDGDNLFCLFDWGDGTFSDWLGPYASSEQICASHAWSKKGTYEIRVKLKDIYGQENDWSDTQVITIYELKKTIMLGSFANLTTEDGFIIAEAVNLWTVQARPFKVNHLITPETIIFSSDYEGIKTQRFIIGVFDVADP